MTFQKGYTPWNKGLTKETDKRVKHTAQKISLGLKGHPVSEKTRKLIGTANRGRNKGRHFSPKTEFTSERVKKMWENKEHRYAVLSKTSGTRFKSGEEHWNWKGGVSPESNMRIQKLEWQKIRKMVWKRDNYTCQNCGQHGKVHAHHIIPYRISKDDSLENLISLCQSCHMKTEWGVGD